MTRGLDRKDISTIVNALRVAAEKFDEDAKVCARAEMHLGARQQLVKQFELQAHDSRDLAELLEDGEFAQVHINEVPAYAVG